VLYYKPYITTPQQSPKQNKPLVMKKETRHEEKNKTHKNRFYFIFKNTIK
jgi:hypothetical protein